MEGSMEICVAYDFASHLKRKTGHDFQKKSVKQIVAARLTGQTLKDQ